MFKTVFFIFIFFIYTHIFTIYVFFKPAHGSTKLQAATNLGSKILPAVTELFDRIADKKLLVRRLTICAGRLTPDDGCQQIDMFSDVEAEEREKKLQEAVISIKNRYGKNAILRGIRNG